MGWGGVGVSLPPTLAPVPSQSLPLVLSLVCCVFPPCTSLFPLLPSDSVPTCSQSGWGWPKRGRKSCPGCLETLLSLILGAWKFETRVDLGVRT